MQSRLARFAELLRGFDSAFDGGFGGFSPAFGGSLHHLCAGFGYFSRGFACRNRFCLSQRQQFLRDGEQALAAAGAFLVQALVKPQFCFGRKHAACRFLRLFAQSAHFVYRFAEGGRFLQAFFKLCLDVGRQQIIQIIGNQGFVRAVFFGHGSVS